LQSELLYGLCCWGAGWRKSRSCAVCAWTWAHTHLHIDDAIERHSGGIHKDVPHHHQVGDREDHEVGVPGQDRTAWEGAWLQGLLRHPCSEWKLAMMGKRVVCGCISPSSCRCIATPNTQAQRQAKQPLPSLHSQDAAAVLVVQRQQQLVCVIQCLLDLQDGGALMRCRVKPIVPAPGPASHPIGWVLRLCTSSLPDSPQAQRAHVPTSAQPGA